MISECNCEEGSNGRECNENGVCTCMPNVQGDKCEECIENYHNYPNCEGLFNHVV